MLDSIRRLFSGKPAGLDRRPVAAWAKQQGHVFKQVPESDGFAVEGRHGRFAWRLEWGPPQRSYIASRELRLRIDLGLPPDLQMMVLSRSLFDRLEHQTFEDFTQDTRTYAGSEMPEEMRWVAMWAQVPLPGQRDLRQTVAALGVNPEAAAAWLEGPCAAELLAARSDLLLHQPPFVLMCQRGRLYLRMELAQPEVAELQQALRVHAVAASQALRLAGRSAETTDWSARPALP